MWRVNGKPNPCTDLDEILHAHPVQGRFWCRFDPCSLPHLSLKGLKPLKLKNTFLKTVHKTKDVQQVAN